MSDFSCFLCLVSNDKIISAAAPQGEALNYEEISESDMEPPCQTARRGYGGKTATDWQKHVDYKSSDESDLIYRVKKELESLIEADLPPESHPYKKSSASQSMVLSGV